MAISGALSSFTWGTTVVVGVGTASLQITRPTQGITGIGDTIDTFIAGVQTGTASIDLFYDSASAGQSTLMTDLTTATAAKALVITLKAGQTITTTAYCTGADFTTSAGQVVRCTCSFQINGAVTIV
jgi:hypothetical protein